MRFWAIKSFLFASSRKEFTDNLSNTQKVDQALDSLCFVDEDNMAPALMPQLQARSFSEALRQTDLSPALSFCSLCPVLSGSPVSNLVTSRCPSGVPTLTSQPS
jgi:hypothetical protein